MSLGLPLGSPALRSLFSAPLSRGLGSDWLP